MNDRGLSARVFRRATGGVKVRREPAKNRPGSGLSRHFAGWQLGVLSVGIAGLAALLAVPRPVAPDVLPLPTVDRREQARTIQNEGARALAAERRELPFDVRAVGEALHRYGAANYTGDSTNMERELGELRVATGRALKRYGPELLLQLRAVQTQLFLRALSHWEGTGQVDSELRELGGNLLDKARRSGWIASDHRLLMSSGQRRTLFRIRWDGLTGLLKRYPFAPSLDEWRVYYRFLLEHPEAPPGSPKGGPELARALLTERQAYVLALTRRDPYYPAALARGVLAYQLERFDDAAREFRAYLGGHADGPWRLRVQNYLLAALLRARASGD